MDYNKTSRTLAGIFLTGLCISLLAVFTSRTNGPERKSAERFDKAMLPVSYTHLTLPTICSV